MPYQVLKRFKCKETEKTLKPGDPFEGKKERIAELEDLGYIGKTEEKEKSEVK